MTELDVEPGGFEARPRAASHLNHREEDGVADSDVNHREEDGVADSDVNHRGEDGVADSDVNHRGEDGAGGFEARRLRSSHLNHREEDEFDEDSVSLFEGDEGGLEYGQRHALVTLLKQRFISARTHPRDWQVLVENERVLRSRLNDLFLDLAIDRGREVAWKRQAVSETASRFPTLLYDAAWTREETLVLVHLRDRLRAGVASGDVRVFIDREDIVDYIATFRPAHATDEAGDEKRARNAVASVVKSGLLIGAVGDDRYEISEAVEPLLPLELLAELLEALRAANGTEGLDKLDQRDEADLFEVRLDTSSPGGSDYSTTLAGAGGSDYSTTLEGEA